MKNKTVLVYGGTGAQGSAITRALVANGHEVKAVTRSKEKAGEIESSGAIPVFADLADLTAVQEATDGSDAVAFTIPLVFDIHTVANWADNVIKAAQDAGVKCFVFNASGPIPKTHTGITAIDIKLMVAEKLARSGLPVITIEPTLYMGNLAAPWSAPAIVHHGTVAYPLPEQQKVSWVSWESMAEVVAAAVEHPELAGQSFRVGGPEALSGRELADAYAAYLSMPVSYFAVDLKDFEFGLNQAMGEPVGTEIAKLYQWFSTAGADSLAVDNSYIEKALGVRPAGFDSWIETVDWLAIAGQAPAPTVNAEKEHAM